MEQGCALNLARIGRVALAASCYFALLGCSGGAGDSDGDKPFVASPPVSASSGPREAGEMGAAVLRHREELIEIANQSSEISESASQKLRGLLAEPETGMQEFDSQTELIDALYSLGRFPRGMEADTGFIEVASVLELLAVALSSEHTSVSERAFGYLLDYGRPDALVPFAGLVRGGLELNPHPDGVRLLALLPQSNDQRGELLASGKAELDVRARLGDRVAEGAIIRRFKDASDYGAKRSAAQALGYAATEACAKALLAALTSELVNRAPYFDRSIRCDLIEQLARIEPDEALFTVEYQGILRSGEDEYGNERTREYLERVTDWGFRNHQVESAPLSVDPLLIRKKIVLRPIR